MNSMGIFNFFFLLDSCEFERKFPFSPLRLVVWVRMLSVWVGFPLTRRWGEIVVVWFLSSTILFMRMLWRRQHASIFMSNSKHLVRKKDKKRRKLNLWLLKPCIPEQKGWKPFIKFLGQLLRKLSFFPSFRSWKIEIINQPQKGPFRVEKRAFDSINQTFLILIRKSNPRESKHFDGNFSPFSPVWRCQTYKSSICELASPPR